MDRWFFVKNIYSTDQCCLLNATLKSIYYYFLMFTFLHCYVWINMKREMLFSELCTIIYQNIWYIKIYHIYYIIVFKNVSLILKFKQKFHLKKFFLLLAIVQASRGYVLNNTSKYLHVYRHLRGIFQVASFFKY